MKLLLYTDPGAGALLWQLLLALFFAGMFYFGKIKSWFHTRSANTVKNQQAPGKTSTNQEN